VPLPLGRTKGETEMTKPRRILKAGGNPDEAIGRTLSALRRLRVVKGV